MNFTDPARSKRHAATLKRLGLDPTAKHAAEPADTEKIAPFQPTETSEPGPRQTADLRPGEAGFGDITINPNADLDTLDDWRRAMDPGVVTDDGSAQPGDQIASIDDFRRIGDQLTGGTMTDQDAAKLTGNDWKILKGLLPAEDQPKADILIGQADNGQGVAPLGQLPAGESDATSLGDGLGRGFAAGATAGDTFGNTDAAGQADLSPPALPDPSVVANNEFRLADADPTPAGTQPGSFARLGGTTSITGVADAIAETAPGQVSTEEQEEADPEDAGGANDSPDSAPTTQSDISNPLGFLDHRPSAGSSDFYSDVAQTLDALEGLDLVGMLPPDAPEDVRKKVEDAQMKLNDATKDARGEVGHEEGARILATEDVLRQEYKGGNLMGNIDPSNLTMDNVPPEDKKRVTAAINTRATNILSDRRKDRKKEVEAAVANAQKAGLEGLGVVAAANTDVVQGASAYIADYLDGKKGTITTGTAATLLAQMKTMIDREALKGNHKLAQQFDALRKIAGSEDEAHLLREEVDIGKARNDVEKWVAERRKAAAAQDEAKVNFYNTLIKEARPRIEARQRAQNDFREELGKAVVEYEPISVE